MDYFDNTYSSTSDAIENYNEEDDVTPTRKWKHIIDKYSQLTQHDEGLPINHAVNIYTLTDKPFFKQMRRNNFSCRNKIERPSKPITCEGRITRSKLNELHQNKEKKERITKRSLFTLAQPKGRRESISDNLTESGIYLNDNIELVKPKFSNISKKVFQEKGKEDKLLRKSVSENLKKYDKQYMPKEITCDDEVESGIFSNIAFTRSKFDDSSIEVPEKLMAVEKTQKEALSAILKKSFKSKAHSDSADNDIECEFALNDKFTRSKFNNLSKELDQKRLKNENVLRELLCNKLEKSLKQKQFQGNPFDDNIESRFYLINDIKFGSTLNVSPQKKMVKENVVKHKAQTVSKLNRIESRVVFDSKTPERGITSNKISNKMFYLDEIVKGVPHNFNLDEIGRMKTFLRVRGGECNVTEMLCIIRHIEDNLVKGKLKRAIFSILASNKNTNDVKREMRLSKIYENLIEKMDARLVHLYMDYVNWIGAKYLEKKQHKLINQLTT